MSGEGPGGEAAISPSSVDIEAAIERCVRLFYAKAHADPLLGPVMSAHIADFERHVATICDFWSRSLLGTARYEGRPYPAHVGLPIRPQHFERWLALFAEAANAELPAGEAQAAIEKAQLMARSFMAGLFPLETPRIAAHHARVVFEWPAVQSDHPQSRRS